MISLFYIAAVLILILVTILADVLIKNASLQTAFTGWKSLVLGCIIYGLTGIGWFFVTRKFKLSTLGVWYSIGCIVLLALVSVFYFKEKISSIEIVGITLAVSSIIIMARFA